MDLSQEKIDELRARTLSSGMNFISGKWVQAAAGAKISVISPIDGRKLTYLASSDEIDVNAAVKAARHAFENGVWSRLAPVERKNIMLRWAELIEKNALEIAILGAMDNGTDIRMAIKGEPITAAKTIRFYAEAIDKVNGEITPTKDDILSMIYREPVGVVGVIIPWNFPLMIGTWKLAPALALGNSIVLKPSEEAALSTLRIVELAAEAGLPEGVLNVVNGNGISVGQAIGLHMDIDVLAFTGSGGVGRKLLEYSAQSNMKRVYLELGGKSPNIVFADAPDLDQAAAETAASIFRNNGQVCVAASRLIVEKPIYNDFLAAVKKNADKLKIGDPLNLANNTGPLANKAQLNKTVSAVQKAYDQGATIYSGGNILKSQTGGFYHEPTIISDVQSSMSVAQDEIFGPVLAARSFDTEEQAYMIANETIYGLSSVVWTEKLSKAHRAIKNIKSGIVQVNCYSGADVTAPLGGVKQSGNGYDRSIHSFDKYENRKSAWIKL